MALSFIEEHRFDSGFMRDLVASQLGPGQLYDAQNFLFDKPGIARTRLGHSAISALGAVAANATSLGFVYSGDVSVIEELYGANARSSAIVLINKTTGALTTTIVSGGFASNFAGRGVRHFGFLTFPMTTTSTGLRVGYAVAGQTTTTTFTSAATSTVVQGNQTITLSGADTTANIRVGAIVRANNAGGTLGYLGRVTSIVTGTTFTVSPTPPVGFTAAIGNLLCTPYLPDNGYGIGTCGASFQNRLLWANTNEIGVAGAPVNDRRIIYSPLPTEQALNAFLTGPLYGATYLLSSAWPVQNFIDSPGADPIIGIEPISDNELLILTQGRPVVFRGELITITATTNPTSTWDITELDRYANCANEHSIQRTPRGVIWAGHDGIFCYTGRGNVENLLEGRNATYWRDQARAVGGAFFVHGSAYVRGHYIVAAQAGGTPYQLCLNLQSKQPLYSRMTNVDMFCAVARPSNPAQVWAARWWDQASAPPNFTNGQYIRLESMFDNYVAGTTTTDSDGSAMNWTIVSRALPGDPDAQKMWDAVTLRYAAATPVASNIIFIANPTNDPSGSSGSVGQMARTLGFVSNTESRLISAATNATPIVCTVTNHGLQNQDFVDIDGGTGLTNINGRWRITVVNANSFSLNGSIGNGAYGANSAGMRKLTEQGYDAGTLDASQALVLTLTSSGSGCNYFELHGFRLASLNRPAVFAA